ncbi:longitudinals lacking protein-like [Andrena cerasifolii]|uniref:longitudinals lacking protein-like n=1 Tax=Andrena cerasifolii TaxID=2819439 RepID=UPI0040379FA7
MEFAKGLKFTSDNVKPLRFPRGQPMQHYMCGECGKGYKWMANLRRHQRLECGKLPKHHCRLCRKTFYRRYELTNHFIAKHGAV